MLLYMNSLDMENILFNLNLYLKKMKTQFDTLIIPVKVSNSKTVSGTIISNNVIKGHRGPDKLLPITVLNKCYGKVKES